MSRVLVTHADEPLGRRVVKTLLHDPGVEALVAVGTGPPPRTFDHMLSDPSGRARYLQGRLDRHRSAADLFGSASVRESAVDTVVHVPRHGPRRDDDAALPSGLSSRTAEARLVLQHALGTPSIRALVALGSAFVYRLAPGAANRLREDSELELGPATSDWVRSWVDSDMLFHAEVGSASLRVVLLRLPTVVSSGGYVHLHPALDGAAGPRWRPLGFDPHCALVSDKDVGHGVAAAVRSARPGVYNLAGLEALPLSVLGRWTGRPVLPVPGGLLRAAAGTLALLGARHRASALAGPQVRHGFTLDTTRAREELGFRPRYRITLARAGDGVLRLETARV